MSEKSRHERGPDHDSPAGDSAEGAPRLESTGGAGERDSEIFVNQAFIDRHGVEAARNFQASVERVSLAGHGTDVEAVHEHLGRLMGESGIEIPPVELEKIADRIARSAHTHVSNEDLHEDERADQRLLDGEG
ncbi:hypothetical protein [Agilicoccus flavus]|uniref:hypothetical protein n=1 Tax=Agilicoccus flavus TaxID=2775968 RepID=UPI001CF6D669|nr:hypothetical protein [Agilicoccus flavus]